MQVLPLQGENRQILLMMGRYSQQLFYKMQKNQIQGLSKCDIHAFSLKALHKQRRPNLSAGVVLCRGKKAKGKKNSNCSCFEGATFNRDRCHATPAFILPSEKTEYLASTREFLRDHEKKVRQYEQEQSQLLVPKPRSKNMYCNVCREGYEEYIEHIRSYSHRTNIHSCPFNHFILDLERQFRGTEHRELTLNSSEIGSPTVAEEEGEQFGVRGRKRVKTDIQQINNAAGSPPAETYQHCTFTGSTQNIFYPQPSFQNPFDMWGRMGECRPFYNSCAAMGFNPYLQVDGQNMGYFFYFVPCRPATVLEVNQLQS